MTGRGQMPQTRAELRSDELRKQRAREDELADVRAVLATPQGRRMVWRLITHCRVFQSIWRPSAEIHYLEGARNVGLYVLGEITEAQPDALLQMMQENKTAQEHTHA